VLDCAGAITPGEGLSLAAALEDFHPLWLDEPAGGLSGTALAQIAGGATTAVGYGRSFHDNARFQDLLRLDAIDVLRPDIVGMSLLEIRQAAALAESYYVAVAPFQRSGPIATAAAFQLAAAIPNFVIQEVPFVSAKDRAMRDALVGGGIETPVDGFFRLPGGPGLGITVDAAVLEQYRSPRGEV
jgi:galactonate dehydratase